jgi:branched-chain amino acid transport system ATP-binding protein
MSAHPILEVTGLSKNFGGITAVSNVSFDLFPGEIIGLIGPNGAGKTTLVNLFTGAFPANAGKVVFDGTDVTRQKPYQAARRGIARTFQIVQPFPAMTVLQNATAGALFARKTKNISAAEDEAMEHLRFVGLDDIALTSASALTLPNRKRLELAKSLAMNPRILMLDEVNAGLNASEIDGALDLIRQISARGITIILIEHLMKVVFSLSHRVLVLHHGKLIAQGKPDDVSANERVIEAYLGSKFAQRQKQLTKKPTGKKPAKKKAARKKSPPKKRART